MRAWTIFLFILGIHIVLGMISVANITNVGLNMSIDTTQKGSIIIMPEKNISMQAPDPRFINTSGTDINTIKGSSSNNTLAPTNFVAAYIQNIFAAADAFIKLLTSFSQVVFTIYYLGAPWFGGFNALALELMVDSVFAISLFQLVTGRSFKTMD